MLVVTKQLGKLSRSQLRRTLALANDLPTLQNMSALIAGQPRFRQAIDDADQVFSWAWAYDLSMPELVAFLFCVIDAQDELAKVVRSDDPQEAILELAESYEAPSVTPDTVPFARKLLALELMIALCKTFECYRSYSQPLCDLVAKARAGDADALCNAVRIDPTVLATPSIAQCVSEAVLNGDKKLLRKIKSSYMNPRQKLAMYPDLRLVEVVLRETGAFLALRGEQLYELIVNDLGLYDHRGGDPRKSLLTLFKRWREASTT